MLLVYYRIADGTMRGREFMQGSNRIFDRASQEDFARISCDLNPIHVDPVAARRTHAGAPIVHGIHLLLWMLECFSRSDFRARGAKTLQAQFLRPVYVGDEVHVSFSRSTSSTVRASLHDGSEELANATLGFRDVQAAAFPMQSPTSPRIDPPAIANARTLDEVEGINGVLSFGPGMVEIGKLFPSAVAAFGFSRIACLVSSTCLVGMVVPGLHSMFSGLDVSLVDTDRTNAPEALSFAVTSVDTRFRLIRIGIRGPGLQGTLKTIMRMPPVRQASMDHVLSLVSRDEFRNTRALVVGGSRGLGELTAKLLAAGGAQVTLTYASGKADAEAVAKEIGRSGAQCATVHYDVYKPALDQLLPGGATPTQVYYFATPPIGRRKSGLFDASRFAELSHFYIRAFYDLLQACSSLNPNGVRALYPSSVYIESRPAGMTEYAMAKAAAEALCSDMQRFIPGVKVFVRRLPRMSTDQTNSVVQVKSANAVTILLPIIREMHS